MLNQIKLFPFIILFSCTFVFGKSTKEIISEFKANNYKLEKLYQEKSNPNKKQILGVKNNNFKLKMQLLGQENELNNPIYYKNDIVLDYNIDLVDFYVYEYSEDYYQVFGKIKNKSNKYLDFVRIEFILYNNNSFVLTDFCYNDLESYGNEGLSPYKTGIFHTYIDKVTFDNISFDISYHDDFDDEDILWDQLLLLEAVTLTPFHENSYKWQGVVKNNFNYSVTYPKIFALIMLNGRMICNDFTFINMSEDSFPANSTKTFDSYIELPEEYDKIEYFISYSLNSLEGTGNLPPNKPIFVDENISGYDRVNTTIETFVIDPNGDRIDLSVDLGNGEVSPWVGNYFSGYGADFEHNFTEPGDFSIKAKASDGILESGWSDSINITISSSTTPTILTTTMENATYKNAYSTQLQSTGGIFPVNWAIINGEIPNGLALVTSNGTIAGNPLQSGNFELSIECRDSGYPVASDTITLNLTVTNQSPFITSPDTIISTINSILTYTATANDPDENPLVFEFLNVPEWLNINDATLSGLAPNQRIESQFQVIATDGELADTLDVFLVIGTTTLQFVTNNIQNAVYKNNYTDSLVAIGGMPPYSWSLLDGKLPKGLKLDNLSGHIFGIPDSSAIYQFSILVQDNDTPPQIDTLSIPINVINNPPQITSADTISIKKGDELNYTAIATDPENNELNIVYKNTPSWIIVDGESLTGNVPLNADDTSLTLIASDGELSDTLIVTIDISDPTNIENSKLPDNFSLSQAYPNPFNPATSIQINVPVRSKIHLDVYDVTGKLVDQLYDGYVHAGTHHYTWEADHHPSGIYFIQFSSEKYKQIVKCTLVK